MHHAWVGGVAEVDDLPHLVVAAYFICACNPCGSYADVFAISVVNALQSRPAKIKQNSGTWHPACVRITCFTYAACTTTLPFILLPTYSTTTLPFIPHATYSTALHVPEATQPFHRTHTCALHCTAPRYRCTARIITGTSATTCRPSWTCSGCSTRCQRGLQTACRCCR